jgi:hypothetical protein
MFPCPACGKATKVTQDESLRICSLCRKVSPASQCTAANAPKPKRKAGMDDAVGTQDTSFGWLENEAVPPIHPCIKCGRETKAHHEEGMRVCRPCNLVQ